MHLLNLHLDHSTFFCRVTVQAIASREIFSPSPATVFTYLDDLGGFIETDETILDFAAKIDSGKHLDAEDPLPRVIEVLDNNNIVVFSITTSGYGLHPPSAL